MAANFWKSTQCNNWTFTQEELARSTTKQTEFLQTQENVSRAYIFFCDVMQKLVEQLKLPNQVSASAIVFFKRFTHRHTLAAVDPFLLSQTCVYIAAKSEECGPILLKQIINATSKAKPQYKDLWPTFKPEEVIECEFLVFSELDFCLILYHPYQSLVEYTSDAKQNETVLPLAWSIVNDSLRSNLCLLYPPHLIALAAIQMACTTLEIDLSSWFAELNFSISEMMDITQHLIDLYAIMTEYTPANGITAVKLIQQEVAKRNSPLEL